MVVMPGWRSYRRMLRRARSLRPRDAARQGGWLVLAPHPDDETLGPGGLISALSAAGGTVAVAFLTDGSGSHDDAPGWNAGRIAALRRREAGEALRALGHADVALMLGWHDAMPFVPGSADYESTARRLVAFCRRQRIREIVTTWEGDLHCDHQAAARLATDVARRLGIRVRFFCIWGWTFPDIDRRLSPFAVHAVPVQAWRGRQRRALGCHRSQLGGRIFHAARRFVLPRPMRRLAAMSHILLLERRRAT